MGRPSREERREQILEAARDVFAEKGYHRATVEDIVARVEVARGTFYLYFEDKRAAFSALVDGFFERITAAIHSIEVDDAEHTPLDQLRGNILRLTELALAEPATMKVVLHDTAGVDPDFEAQLESFYAALRQFLAESLEVGQGIGLVRDGDREIMVALGIGGLKQILLSAVTGELPRTAEQLTDEIMRFFESGMLAR